MTKALTYLCHYLADTGLQLLPETAENMSKPSASRSLLRPSKMAVPGWKH